MRGEQAVLRPDFTGIAERAAQVKQRQADVLSRCPPWSVDLCPTTGCQGYYEAPHPDDPKHRVPVPCPNVGRRACPAVASQEAVRYAGHMAHCGFPTKYQHPEQDRIRRMDLIGPYCEDLEENVRAGRGLIIAGPPGVGKTMCLAWIAAEAFRRECSFSARYVFSPTLFDALHGSADAVGQYSRYGLLMLDDLGREYKAEWTLARFEALIEALYGNERAVCVTTNCSLTELHEDASLRRITDRLWEMCAKVVVSGKTQRPSL